jgi:hypothetical protein
MYGTRAAATVSTTTNDLCIRSFVDQRIAVLGRPRRTWGKHMSPHAPAAPWSLFGLPFFTMLAHTPRVVFVVSLEAVNEQV